MNQIEKEMCNYLDWELTVDDSIFFNFQITVKVDFTYKFTWKKCDMLQRKCSALISMENLRTMQLKKSQKSEKIKTKQMPNTRSTRKKEPNNGMFYLLASLHCLKVPFSIVECTRTILTHKRCAPAVSIFLQLKFERIDAKVWGSQD